MGARGGRLGVAEDSEFASQDSEREVPVSMPYEIYEGLSDHERRHRKESARVVTVGKACDLVLSTAYGTLWYLLLR